MKIKALSLWQPWAGLVASGAKKYETRSKLTRHRGPLLICSAKKWNRHLGAAERDFMKDGAKLDPWMRKLGVALCIVDVMAVYEIETSEIMINVDHPHSNTYALPNVLERQCGNYDRGRFAWRLGNLRPLMENSFEVVGRQFLFDVEIDPELLEVRRD